MILLNFERWNGMAGRYMVKKRLYWKGYVWTPLVWMEWGRTLRRLKQKPVDLSEFTEGG